MPQPQPSQFPERSIRPNLHTSTPYARNAEQTSQHHDEHEGLSFLGDNNHHGSFFQQPPDSRNTTHDGQFEPLTTPGIQRSMSVPQMSPVHLGIYDGTAYITKLANTLRLVPMQQQSALEFNQLPPDPNLRLAVLHTRLLAMESQTSTALSQMSELKKGVDTVIQYTKTRWDLDAGQKSAIKTQLNHQLLKSNMTFKNAVGRTMEEISKHRASYHLEAIRDNEVVKAVVEAYLDKEITGVRNKFRKMIFKWSSAPLDVLVQKLTSEFHKRKANGKVSEATTARIALARQIAVPMAAKKNTKGADTGFWKALETALNTLVKKNSSNAESDAWKVWEKATISTDKSTYISDPTIPSDDDDDTDADNRNGPGEAGGDDD
ncbi:hypothetical protein BDN72DRAFT_838980 [Pluteus cervinus]|uniref:Uncharacterized protein n=1 Tax=Pluteus cervinus TaxID=181527 RepID=A0ACD3AXK5_9AGAR|nr:hypothetical protein BDN72DRAFT_838980 [Pluteus cervinus]